MDDDLKREIFEFLDSLRKSGEVNMAGAAPIARESFGLRWNEARQVAKEWRETYYKAASEVSK